MTLLLWAASSQDPTTEALVGTWANLDGETWRVFEFAPVGEEPAVRGLADAFVLYFYEDGEAPAAVLMGTYGVYDSVPINVVGGVAYHDNVLVTEVVWAVDVDLMGLTYGDPILSWTPRRMAVRSESHPDGRRTWEAVEALP